MIVGQSVNLIKATCSIWISFPSFPPPFTSGPILSILLILSLSLSQTGMFSYVHTVQNKKVKGSCIFACLVLVFLLLAGLDGANVWWKFQLWSSGQTSAHYLLSLSFSFSRSQFLPSLSSHSFQYNAFICCNVFVYCIFWIIGGGGDPLMFGLLPFIALPVGIMTSKSSLCFRPLM